MSSVAPTRPEEYQPALGPWSQAWRLLLALAISGLAWATVERRTSAGALAIEAVAGLPAVALVLVRRRYPITVAVLTGLLSAASALAAGPATLAAVSLATRRRWPQVVGIGVLTVAAGLAFDLLRADTPQTPRWVTLLSAVLFTAAALAWGMYVGSRRELLWTLRERAQRAEDEQSLRAEQARAAERGRIAREMHDVLAHRITQIAMRAGALGYRHDLSAEEVHESAELIQQAAHAALTDLRDVLGVLRDERGEVVHTPQPTYDDLPDLVSQAREAGDRIVYAADLTSDEPVPEATGRALYRIVQEGITNARKHAPGAQLAIALAGSPDDGIEVTLRNPLGFGPPTAPGAGLGLVGLAERAALRGGRLEHRHDDAEFVLQGWLPWAA